MTITSIIMSAAFMVAATSPTTGVSPVERVTMQTSADAVSAIRLPEGQTVLDVVVQDPISIKVDVADPRTIALRGVPDASGSHLLVRRAGAEPLDVLLLPSAKPLRSQVLRIGTPGAPPVPEWHLDGGRLSLLQPGFAVSRAYATTGARIESLGDDGGFVATRGHAARGDVLVVGFDGGIGIYRLD